MARLRVAVLLILPLLLVAPCRAQTCPVAAEHVASEAEREFLRGHYESAMSLYKRQLERTPGDPDAVVGLTRTLLRQQKVFEAEAVITPATARDTKSVALQTALGEVQLRAGTPWLAAETVEAAMKIDGCYARLRLLNSRLLRLNSMYASAAVEMKAAHKIDPQDPEIRLSWLKGRSLTRRITELESYLASDTGDDPQELSHLRLYLASLKKQAAEPHPPCRLVSKTTATAMPFVALHNDGVHMSFYGLALKLNDTDAQFQVDTGASGLTVIKSFAEAAHLTRFTDAAIGGVGSGAELSSYKAYADSIKIGSLEFQNCQVNVVDKHFGMESQGLIGTDVFAGFLVTLDYPERRVLLEPLPRRPEDVEALKPSLETSSTSSGVEEPTVPPAVPSGLPDAPSSEAIPPIKVSRGPRDRYIAPEMAAWTRVYRVNHLLLLPTGLNGSTRKLFILDTGAFATTISPDAARSVTEVSRNDKMKIYGIRGQVKDVYVAKKVEFVFGEVKDAELNVAAFENPTVSKEAGTEISGMIGAPTLQRMSISIDYRDGLVKFRIPEEPKDRYLEAP